MMNWAFSKARGKVVDDENRTIAVVTACGRKLAEADRIGYLLAAAPEMFEALEAADECLALIEDVGHGAHMDNVTVARKIVLDAIAKAKEGGTP